MRNYPTGANRSNNIGKPDYEACISPLVLRRYAQHIANYRLQDDGKIRADDNWQKGIPFDDYMKSLVRHVIDAWGMHRGMWLVSRDGGSLEDTLCAVMFNAMGYLHEALKADTPAYPAVSPDEPARICRTCAACAGGRLNADEGICKACVITEHSNWMPKEADGCNTCKYSRIALNGDPCRECFNIPEHPGWELKYV